MTKNTNTGNWNAGYKNTGDRNTGDRNTGDRNTGDRNTGYKNTGDWNTGDWNTGYKNAGYKNTGNRNTGDRNTGYKNAGNWNKCNYSTGMFNTITPDDILIFNKPCSREVWNNAAKPDFLYFDINVWVSESNMTEQEKVDNKYHYVAEGYLKSITPEEAWKIAWENKEDGELELLLALPNFDAEVFKEISGIDVNANTLKTITIDGIKYQEVK